MRAQEFVSELAKISPSKEDYLAFGFSEELATQISMEYNFTPLASNSVISGGMPDDELIILLNSYNTDCVQIGLITFFSTPEESQEFVYVGRIELDILAVKKTSLEVVVLDHDDLNWIIWPCAANSSCFLDAILAFASFLTYKVKKKIITNTGNEDYECALLCTEKAGGEKYIDFYKMLLGIDDSFPAESLLRAL